jgi:nitrite reductase (NADH) small subunit
MSEVRVGSVEEIPENEGRMLRAGGHLVAVFRLREGGVRAVQPWCPHRAGPLADGLVGDGSLVCPLHGRTFDLTSGEALRGEVGIATYPARVEADGTIVLELPDDGPPPCTTDADAEALAETNGAGAPDPPFAAPVEELAE